MILSLLFSIFCFYSFQYLYASKQIGALIKELTQGSIWWLLPFTFNFFKVITAAREQKAASVQISVLSQVPVWEEDPAGKYYPDYSFHFAGKKSEMPGFGRTWLFNYFNHWT